MEKNDTMRVILKPKNMMNVEFSLYGLPTILLKLFSVLTCENLETFSLRKAEQLYMPAKLEMLKKKLEKVVFVDEITQREYQILKQHRINFTRLNFRVYEQFFRLFCVNPNSGNDFLLRASKDSLAKGICKLYDGLPNESLCTLLYNFFGKGTVNHLITFSEFVRFINDLHLSR